MKRISETSMIKKEKEHIRLHYLLIEMQENQTKSKINQLLAIYLEYKIWNTRYLLYCFYKFYACRENFDRL